MSVMLQLSVSTFLIVSTPLTGFFSCPLIFRSRMQPVKPPAVTLSLKKLFGKDTAGGFEVGALVPTVNEIDEALIPYSTVCQLPLFTFGSF